MKSTYTRLVGAIAAAAASGAAGFYLWPATHSKSVVTDRNAAAEVRTQVIHRTVHVVRHPKAKASTAQPVALNSNATSTGGARSTTNPAKAGTTSGGVQPLVRTGTSATGTTSTSGSTPITTSSSPTGSESESGDDGGSGAGGDD